MGASSPNPRYFKDGSGLRPNWRFALRWPKQYAWRVSPRWFKKLRFAVQRWRHQRPACPALSNGVGVAYVGPEPVQGCPEPGGLPAAGGGPDG